MSDFNLDDELILDYLAESREHLTTIETDLLCIEQAGEAIDDQVVNRVFRAAHSIKGGAGFFDLLVIKELAHGTESVLDLIRSRQIIPNSEIVNVLFTAFDKLRDLIGNFRNSNSVDISEFSSALGRIARAQPAASPRQSVSQALIIPVGKSGRRIESSAADLNEAVAAGKSVYVIEYDLMDQIQMQGKTPHDLLNHLMRCGAILAAAIDLESTGTLDSQPANRLPLDVLYATVLDNYYIGQILDLPPERVHRMSLESASEDAAQAVPMPPPVREAAHELPIASEPVEHLARVAAVAVPAPQVEATVRLNVALLDSLMTLAGELVLGRNQLNEAVRNGDKQGINAGAHRVSLVTSELQEAVSLTRMQPVSSLFSKFPRLVRDLANQLGKDVQLKLEGGEVELDKTILEGLSDPLTHMVRNSVDHGIETPAARRAADKPPQGIVTLAARHQAGQIVIEISDDGKGLSGEAIAKSALAKGMITAAQLLTMSDFDKQALIFMPGVSTAEKLSNVSGRGVGMDVVKTNLDKLGGKVEIDSVPGKGSGFRIKLPLTLAIIPSLLISDSGERFAIPQVSVRELIRIPANQISERVERVGDAEVVLLRDRLVPLIHLAEALGGPKKKLGDRALNIVLVDTGTFEYGLVVQDLHDTVEIVVKPMGRHLQFLSEYAGATILGDGQVAVILDVAGLAARAGLSRTAATTSIMSGGTEIAAGEMHSLLLFHNAPGEHCAVPIELVTRVASVRREQVQSLGGRRTMHYGGVSLPLVALHDVAAVGELAESQQLVVVVFDCAGRSVGLLVAEPLDMIEAHLALDTVTLRQSGVAGSALLNGETTLMLDIFELTETVRRRCPEPNQNDQQVSPAPPNGATVLVVEDSEFFRGQIKRMVEAVGYKVLAAEDGQVGWELLDRHGSEISLVTTDIEMPRLDGLGLTKRIRADSRFANLPVIALSSLAGEEEMALGLAMGVSEYQVKLDQNQLLESIAKAISGKTVKQQPLAA